MKGKSWISATALFVFHAALNVEVHCKMFDFTIVVDTMGDCGYTLLCKLNGSRFIHEIFLSSKGEALGKFHEQILQGFPALKNGHNSPMDLHNLTYIDTEAKSILCNMTKTERERGVRIYSVKSLRYASSVCLNPFKRKLCKDLEDSSMVFDKAYKELIKEGHCEDWKGPVYTH